MRTRCAAILVVVMLVNLLLSTVPAFSQPAGRQPESTPAASSYPWYACSKEAGLKEGDCVIFASFSHLKFSWRNSWRRLFGKNPTATARDAEKSKQEGWWGEPIPVGTASTPK